jgi:tellurite resistance protein
MNAEIFTVLAAVASADGKVDAAESAALERAARDAGLGDDALSKMRAATTRGLDALDASIASNLAPSERTFVYALAYWMSRVDGEMSEEEDAVLARLGALLALGDAVRMNAEAAVDEVAALPEGTRPARFDFARLRSTLSL